MSNFWEQLKKPIIGLSPMDGVTDFPMREITAYIAKPAVMFTEFLNCEGFCKKPEKFQHILKFSPKQRPIVVQLFGASPSDFKKALEKIIPLGFDGVDINMGCPDRAVVKKGGGAALIGNFNLSRDIIEVCLSVLEKMKKPIPLSVKTRLTNNSSESFKWFTHLARFPLSAVTIHGRNINQKVSGEVNWDIISKAAAIFQKQKILALGNGGVKSVYEAEEKCVAYHLDGILIGQAALGNPWVFKKDYPPTKEKILQTILKHAHLAWDFYGEKNFNIFRKHLGWYPRNFSNSKALRVKLLQTTNLQQVEEILLRWKFPSI